MRTTLLLAASLAFLLALGGCTHVYTLNRATYQIVNQRAEGRAAEVMLADGTRAAADALRLAPDSTSWLEPATGLVHTVATADVVRVEFRERGQGALEGLVLGGAGGFAVGAAAGAASYRPEDDTGFIHWGRWGTAQLVGAVVGLVGGGVGLLVGAGRGSKNVFRVPSEAE